MSNDVFLSYNIQFVYEYYRIKNKLSMLPLHLVAVSVSCSFFLTRNSSEDEIANVNFLYDDIVHLITTEYNRLVRKFRHRSTRRLRIGTYLYQIQ